MYKYYDLWTVLRGGGEDKRKGRGGGMEERRGEGRVHCLGELKIVAKALEHRR